MFDSVGGELRNSCRISLLGKKWKYRGEGNANLVLALPQERKILRLWKCEGRAVDRLEETETERAYREALFCRLVMVPLLGECYIQPPTTAYLDKSEVQVLNQVLQAQRPAHRHHKGLHLSHIAVYPDYAVIPSHLSVASDAHTFCVEVKPKQGWIPLPDRRMAKCTFCLNQYLKIKNGSIKSKSQYCPLHLFSGNSLRMKTALEALLATPQNNLKIFEDGVLVYGEDSKEDVINILQRWLGNIMQPVDRQRLVEKFCCLVLEALTRDLTLSVAGHQDSPWDDLDVLYPPEQAPRSFSERVPSSLITAVTRLLPEQACDWSYEELPLNCILARILSIQRLDQSGADWVYQVYWNRASRARGSDYSYVAAMLKAGPNLTPLHRYLLATTAKDCSIMMSFQRLPDYASRYAGMIPPQHVVHDLDSQHFVFNVGVSDLDPKPLSCIEKHRKRDCEALAACLELHERSQEIESEFQQRSAKKF